VYDSSESRAHGSVETLMRVNTAYAVISHEPPSHEPSEAWASTVRRSICVNALGIRSQVMSSGISGIADPSQRCKNRTRAWEQSIME